MQAVETGSPFLSPISLSPTEVQRHAGSATLELQRLADPYIQSGLAPVAIACLLDSRSRPHNWGTFRMANACDSCSTIGRGKRCRTSGKPPAKRMADNSRH